MELELRKPTASAKCQVYSAVIELSFVTAMEASGSQCPWPLDLESFSFSFSPVVVFRTY